MRRQTRRLLKTVAAYSEVWDNWIGRPSKITPLQWYGLAIRPVESVDGGGRPADLPGVPEATLNCEPREKKRSRRRKRKSRGRKSKKSRASARASADDSKFLEILSKVTEKLVYADQFREQKLNDYIVVLGQTIAEAYGLDVQSRKSAKAGKRPTRKQVKDAKELEIILTRYRAWRRQRGTSLVPSEEYES